VEPGDIPGLARSIEQLLSDEQLARKMSDAGPAHAARWSASHHAKCLEAVYIEAFNAFHRNRKAQPVSLRNQSVGAQALM
jgi:hypothetical protein